MSRSRGWSGRPAFTLVELLVVIAIIGVLVALLLPAVQAAREAANRMSCGNNLKQIGIAMHNYHDTNKALPEAGWRRGTAGTPTPAISWRVPILPFMEESPLYDQFNMTLQWNSTIVNPISNVTNYSLATVNPGSYHCPSAGKTNTTTTAESTTVNGVAKNGVTAHYYGILGPSGNDQNGIAYGWDPADAGHGGFGTTGVLIRVKNGEMDFAAITDGLSNTLLVGESSFQRTLAGVANTSYRSWTRGCADGACASAKNVNSGLKIDAYNGSNNFNMVSMGSEHSGGAQFLLGDGSVKFVGATIDYNVYRAAATRGNGESLQLP